jgi:hypothetical protein
VKKDMAKVINSFENERVRVTIYDDKTKPFSISQKPYKSVGSLFNKILIAHASELFPCFDTSDFIYENRYCHWFFLCQSLRDYMTIKRLIKEHKLPRCQFYGNSALSTWEKNYSSLHVTMVYCQDDLTSFTVVEPI